MRHDALDEGLVARSDERAGRAVGHRERATVDVGRGREEVCERALMNARVRAVPSLVSRGDDAKLRGEAFGDAPERRDFDAVNALAPRVPLRQARLAEAVFELRPVQLAAREFAHLDERRLDLAESVRRERAPKVRAERAVVFVLVAESRWLLAEGHRRSSDALTFALDVLMLLRVFFFGVIAWSGFGLGLVALPAPHVGHLPGLGVGHVVAGDFGDAVFDFDDFPVGRFRVAPVAPLCDSDFKRLRVLFLFGHRLSSSLTIY